MNEGYLDISEGGSGAISEGGNIANWQYGP